MVIERLTFHLFDHTWCGLWTELAQKTHILRAAASLLKDLKSPPQRFILLPQFLQFLSALLFGEA